MNPNSPRDLPDWRLLDAWLAGTASPAERAVVEQWMAEDARNAEFARSLQSAFRVTESAGTDVDRGWEATRRLMAHSRPAVVEIRSRRSFMRFAPAIAATIVVAVGLGVFAARNRAPRMIEFVTAAGQRETRVLEDGTSITLNARSRLRYPSRFAGTRDVELDGEALFVVAHDAARPFRVLSQGGVATDLGTRFVVRGYDDLDRLEVGVTEGRVSLRRESGIDSVLLDAGMVGRLDRSGIVAVDRVRDLRALTAWTEGHLTFSATPLKEVAGEIGRRFGVVVRIDESLASRRLSASFQDETLDQVLGAIDVSLGLSHARQGDTVRVMPRAVAR